MIRNSRRQDGGMSPASSRICPRKSRTFWRRVVTRWRTTLAKSGYIAVAGGEKNRYLPGKQYRILRKGKAVACA